MTSAIQLLNQKGWGVLRSDDFSKFPMPDAENQGFVYALEYGEYIKIGQSRNLAKRMKSLISQAKKYSLTDTGRVAYTESHSNYSKNEAFLHSVFKDKRLENGELFAMNLEYFAMYLPNLSYEHNVPTGDITSLKQAVIYALKQKGINLEDEKEKKLTKTVPMFFFRIN